MKSFPPELIYVVIFAAIMLFQFMMKQLGQKAQQEQQERQEQEPQDSMPEEYAARTYEDVAEAAAPPLLAAGHFGRTEARKAAPAAESARRRFSRTSLLGNRHEVQNAVVIASIIGPCRAFEPYDVG